MEFKIEKLSKTIGNKKILNGLNLSLKEGDTLALRGSNGSGKTTLLRIITGLDKDYEGEIEFDQDLTIGYVPQDIVLFESLSVKDNLKAFCNGNNAKDNFIRLENYAKELGFAGLCKKKVNKLSGGQKRLVNFLVGLANNPKLILLDEVIVGIDENTVNKVIELINNIKADRIMIITSHQDEFMKEVCNLSGRLTGGQLELSYEN
ncbi:MAG: ATP-binding cassette domain-containing protein [Catonella sp.]|uniref:ATP-binding cassette domain-containing protein n=1 Tax=Catonella sp. TaxID=2382125 RepID=UPI003FA0DB26